MNTVAPSTNPIDARRALLAARLRAATENAALPLSFAQQRLWFLDQLEPNSALYNMPSLLRLTGRLNVDALQQAIDTVVARHETLRTRFICVNESPAQVIESHLRVQLQKIDLSTSGPREREEKARHLVHEEVNRPFQLSSDPLLRATLIRLQPEEHLLLFTMHHIVSDGWSLGVFFRELSVLYSGIAQGKEVSLPPLTIRYTDYALWQRERLPAFEEQLSYWKEQLKNHPPLLDLPGDHPRRACPTFRGRSEALTLPSELTGKLQRLAHRLNATLFMVLLAAFKSLLHRYTGQADIVVGSPIAGRDRVETEGLIGCFVNTLALRTKFDGDISFEQLVARVREVTLGAYAHQDLPFERLVEELHPERSLSHLPFTRIMFAIQNTRLDHLEWHGLKTQFVEAESDTAKFEVTLLVQETSDGLVARVEYNTDLFAAETIQRLLQHYATLLAGVVADPTRTVSEVPLLPPAERQRLLVEWNDTTTDYPTGKCVHELFEVQAEKTPAAVAVDFGKESLSYKELNARANQLARYLKKVKVGPGVPVAVCMQRSVEMVVAFLAILKAGGAYVPLDANYPAERLAFMLADLGTPLLLTQQRLLPHVPRNAKKLVCLDADWELIARENRQNVPNVATPETMAYVIYTSGSTGQPKGVAVPHRAINRLVRNTNYIRFQASDRIAQISNISFDAATFEIWGALLNGGQLIGISKDIALSPKDFARELREKEITSIFLTTALFNQLASEVPDAFETLSHVLTGGEVADPRWMRTVLAEHPPRRLVNVYGPTENTTFSTYHEVHEVPNGSPVPIGKPIANTQCYILDQNLRPLPIGVPGQLYLGGDGVACGYWNRPELTEQAFISDPFSPPGTERKLYRTGDLARYRADGAIEFLGRIDNQLKIRGFRVEPGEIEATLAQHAAVRECVVKLCGNGSGHKRLVAYFVAWKNPAPNASELRSFLQGKLPDYMVPSAFVPLAGLPLSPNGKVERAALPEPDKARPHLEKKYAAPRDEVESALTAIWEKILGIHPIGIEDKFFDLGGHSLLAVKVIGQIEKQFGKKLRLATIFQAPTIEQLAAIIREEIKESSVTVGTSVVEIQSKGTQRPLFFVHGAGGGMFWGYANLARHLGTDQPVYAFKSRGLDGREELTRIEEIAAQYVADLRVVQPQGPYHLGGYCFGGNVAFEMARQLQAQGERIGLLALMNCAPPNSRYVQVSRNLRWCLRFARNLFYWARYSIDWTPTQRKEFLRWKWGNLRKKLAGIGGNAPAERASVDPGNLVDLSSYSPEQKRLWESHIRALLAYHPQPYQGKVHLFRSPVHSLLCSFDADYGWGDFAREGVEITVVPGAHEKILEEPSVGRLAHELKTALQGVEQTSAAVPASTNRLAVFRGMVVRATLFWLGAHGETLLAEEPGLETEGWTLGMLFHNLAILSGARKPQRESSTTTADAAEELPPEGDIALPPSESCGQPLTMTPGKNPRRVTRLLPLPKGSFGRLQQIAEEEGAGVSVTLLSLAKALLQRYSYGNEVSLDVPMLPDLERRGDLRCAVNELILRTDASTELSFRQLLHRMRESATGSGPVDSGRNARLSRLPLFEVFFNLKNATSTAHPLEQFALGFAFVPGTPEGHGLAAELSYNPAFFDEGSIDRIKGHLETLLEGIATHPDQPMNSLPLLTGNERRQLLRQWNETCLALPVDQSYAAPFEAQAQRTPSAIAACYQDVQLSYRELNARANQLARHLEQLGVGPEVLVGVCLERSLDLLVGLLAVVKAGGAYVPLDPNYPRERLEYMLKDCQAPVLLTRTTLLSAFGVTGVKAVCLDDPHQQTLIQRCPAENAPLRAGKDTLAYVIYTSGSTGQPKGVQITHGSLLNHNWAIKDAYQLQATDRILQFNPISFDISVEEIFPSWLAGATVVMRPDDVIASPAYFLEFVARERLTVLNLPTAYWNEIVEMLRSTTLPESVRLMVIGGEKASDHTFRKWLQRAPQTVRLLNSYGPTEATVTATIYAPTAGVDSLCIGRPIANTQAYILDEKLQPVPIGTTGHLHLGGAGLSRGYLRREQLTAEKFIPNPFAAETPGDRLYKTGDLARFRPDGNIEFLGRADHQVKIRGFRIELGEIEAALQAHPGIKEVAVILREDAPGRKRLVAYFVASAAKDPGVSELIAFLKRKLPNYMVPSAFVPLASLPLTPAGKINRRALPKPGSERPELKERFVAPRTPLEEALAGIWAEVLDVSRVGVHDNFFDLGGHSLLATQVMSRVRDSLQIEAPLAKLFALPTVAELAGHLAEGSAQSQPVLPSSVVSKGRSLPLSIAQRRIWFLDQFEPEQSAYNLPTGLRLIGPLDVRALERALTELSRRHEALRAMFPTEAGQPSQLICEPRDIVLAVIDLSPVAADQRESKTAAILAQESQRPYVMSSPMLRPVLVKWDENEHRLLLILHEIAADRFSVRLLLTELAALYQAFTDRQPLALPPPALPYSEVAGGLRLAPEEERRQLEFWIRQLEGMPPLLELPADHPRPVHQSDAGARRSFRFSRELSEALKRLGEQEGCTPFMTLLALFQVLLARYTGSTDIVVGSTARNRPRKELQTVIARLTNFITLRGDLTGDPTFQELLGRTRTVALGAQANGGIAFGKVLEELQPERNASYTPIFQVLFELEESPLPEMRAAEVQFTPFDIDNQTAKFDLTLHVTEGEAFSAWFEYSTALFDSERMLRMSEHLLTLAQAAVAKPEERISSMPLLPPQETERLLFEWNATAREYPSGQTLIGLFEAQAARTPDAEALICGHTRLSYRQLQTRAQQVAQRLQAEGVGRNSLVGICLERSWEMVAAILGTLRTGAAYVPMDPLYPRERLEFMRADANLQLLLTQRKLQGLVPQESGKVLCVEEIDWTAAGAPFEGETAAGAANDLAYVIYTSGSTGKPKGVAIENRSAVAFVHWAREVYTDEQLAGVLAATSICFDLSIFELFVPLSWGGTVILAENALALPGLPAAREVVLVNTVPSAIRELLRIKGLPPSVQTVNLAGEPLATSLVDQIYAESSVTKVYDLYGPTETTTYSTFTLRQAAEPATIGKPLANEQVLLLDSHQQLVPLGVPGELYIGGAGLAREYLNRPELTAEKFVRHPFAPGQRLYRTGDLARWRSDGNLEYLGRIDHQVKIRGYRIELGEIEAVLKKQATVREVVVVVREDQPGNKRLVAYLALQRGKSPAVEELRAALKQQLPEYMVPGAFVFLDSLPLTPNGKIDRKALPAPEQDRAGAGVEFVPPETPTQKQLSSIWSEVLGCEQVGLHDNFFDLGGHSLLAIQVISRVREVFKVELPLFSLFDAPTIQALARGLESGQWTQNHLPVLPLQPLADTSELPVSFVQERLWFIDQLEPNSCDYNVPMALRLKGRLNVDALRPAIQQLVERHAALRTTFQYADGKLQQAIQPSLELPFPVTDLKDTPAEERAQQAAELVKAEAQAPFDLAQGPLLRASLVRLDAEDHILTVVMHHSISDGWSLGIFFHELELVYEALVTGKATPPLPELPVTYADYAHWQRQWMQGAVLERELQYWQKALASAPPALELPCDAAHADATAKGASLSLSLSPEQATAITKLAQRQGATPFMVLMAGLAITLHKWTSQNDLVIGTVVAGRNRREVENVIGCFMNFLPIRARIEEGETLEALLEQVRATVLEGQSHQECPFEKMVEAINPERQLNRNPLYNVGLLLQNFPAEPFHAEGLTATTMDLPLDAALLDLRFEAEPRAQGLSLRCEYRTDLFQQPTIRLLLEFYRRVLEALTQTPALRLAELELGADLAAQAAQARQPKQQMAMAISSTFTAEPIEEPLRFWANQLGVTGRFQFAPYNQVFQQLLDPSSVLSSNQNGLNVLLLRLEDWQSSARATDGSAAVKAQESIERTSQEFVAALKEAAARNSIPYLVCLCPGSPRLLQDPQWKAFLKQTEQQLSAQLENASGIYLVSSRELAQLYPVSDYHDPEAEELGHVPYTPLFFSALGTLVARKWHALHRPAYKVIVLDCDQTLWSGVCGEDGPRGICIEKPRRILQQFMRAQQDAGMLLCLCSKNNEEDVVEVFAQRLDMPLRREHFAAWRLNWNSKSDNLRSLAEELNLGLDSFIFLDDNPVECAEVRSHCPEVLTLQLPEDPEQIHSFLQHCWAFDHLKLTVEDLKRPEMYRRQRQRDELQAQSLSLAEFLEGLDLKVQIEPLRPDQAARVAQLTQRTNQFNFTTRRRSEAEVLALAGSAEVLSVSVSDRFGDYGLVGVAIYDLADRQALRVDTLLLSCRVLGRGVEHRMVACLGQIARDRQLPWVDLPFHNSNKNKPALDFLEHIGRAYAQASNGGWIFRLPADFAAGLAFNPDATEARPEDAPAERPAAISEPRSELPVEAKGKFEACERIALTLTDPQKIYQALESSALVRVPKRGGRVGPRNDVERQLCELWQKLLHLEQVGVQDNFFELGGHSLLAVRLFAQLEKSTGRKLPLVTLFQSPTIEQLARVLTEGKPQKTGSLVVPIQPNGSRAPLFLVHGAGGDVLWGYANLAARMPDQPIYGLKSRGQAGLDEFTTLTEMAAGYVKEIKAFQPHGPYRVGGYCFGGNVAYEMARQLRAEGETVALVALLDAAPSNAGYETIPWWRPTYSFRFTRNLLYWLKDFEELSADQRRRFIGRKFRALARKVIGWFDRANRSNEVDLEDVIEVNHFPENELKLWQTHLQALVSHVEQPYGGEVLLFRTRGQALFCSLEPDLCWGRLVRQVTVKEIPGSHENIFVEPNVQWLAQELGRALDSADCAEPTVPQGPSAQPVEALDGREITRIET